MSEKRFTVDDDGIYDNHEKRHFKFIAYDWVDCDIYECCGKLNEQQSTIQSLKEENEKLIQKKCLPCELVNLQTREIDKLKDENEQLKEELNNLKKDETLLYHYYTLARYGGDGV